MTTFTNWNSSELNLLLAQNELIVKGPPTLNRLHFCLLIPLTFLAKTSFAQESNTTVRLTPNILSSSGSEREGPDGLSFSVGSLNSIIVLTAEDSFPQSGILQDTSTVADVLTDSIPPNSENPNETARISIYPNPFVDRITLNIANFTDDSGQNFRFELYDLMGNILITGQVGHGQEEISLNSIPKGLFVLLLYKNEKEIKSFKLIKSNQWSQSI